MRHRSIVNRRRILQGLLAATAGATAAGLGARRRASAADGKPRFLIVMGNFGGGAIIDSFLPVRASDSGTPSTVDCFTDQEIVTFGDSPIRAVDARLSQAFFLAPPLWDPQTVLPLSWFAEKHRHQMMVTTLECSSVNHAVAQHRALNGGGAWSGRTLQECVALAYGSDFALPNVNMASAGYLERGDDPSLPGTAYAEAVSSALLKPLGFSAHEGIPGAPSRAVLDAARDVRDTHLDPQSAFYTTFRQSERIARWKKQRDQARSLEAAGLIKKLFFVQESEYVPLSSVGLETAEEYDRLVQLFPSIAAPTSDPLDEQAALACLLLKHRVSVTVTLAPSFSPVLGGQYQIKTPPLAFDGSHQDHRAAQALMWNRVLTVADGIIQFLQETVFDESTGETFWDRSMLHFATDFGRDKTRPADEPVWGTGHHVNNGHLTVSPFVNGNSVLGGVDPDTGLTHGFDLVSGAPDPGRTTSEYESFAGLLQALDIDTSEAGLPDVPAMRA
jgi:hypothetical protein